MVDKSMRLRVSLPEKTTWNWGGTFYPNAPKSGIRVRRSPGINGTIVESGSWLYRKTDWVQFDQVIKKMDIGGFVLNIKHPVQAKRFLLRCL